jgi:hypothetical protein
LTKWFRNPQAPLQTFLLHTKQYQKEKDKLIAWTAQRSLHRRLSLQPRGRVNSPRNMFRKPDAQGQQNSTPKAACFFTRDGNETPIKILMFRFL